MHQEPDKEGAGFDFFRPDETKDPTPEKKGGGVKVNGIVKTFRLLTNKYLIAVLAFLVWILFFDNNNLISRYRVKQELKHLYRQKEYYEREIALNEQIRNQLMNNLKSVEAFGRENYLMKRDNEDIYLIIDEKE